MKILFILLFGLSVYTVQSQNVGIGTATPIHPLTVIGNGSGQGILQKTAAVEIGFYTTGSAFVQTWSAHDLHFTTGNSSSKLMLQHPSGFLGINTTTPTAFLDVNGTLRLRMAGSGLNKVLTSTDASGNAAWGTITRTDVYSLSSVAFHAELSSDPTIRSIGQGGIYFSPIPTANPTFLVAQVNLPQGAVINQVVVYFKDNLPGDLSMTLQKESLTSGTYETVASGNTSGASTAWREITLTPIGSLTVANQFHGYEIRAFGTWPGNSDFAIKGVKITYTYTVNN